MSRLLFLSRACAAGRTGATSYTRRLSGASWRALTAVQPRVKQDGALTRYDWHYPFSGAAGTDYVIFLTHRAPQSAGLVMTRGSSPVGVMNTVRWYSNGQPLCFLFQSFSLSFHKFNSLS